MCFSSNRLFAVIYSQYLFQIELIFFDWCNKYTYNTIHNKHNTIINAIQCDTVIPVLTSDVKSMSEQTWRDINDYISDWKLKKKKYTLIKEVITKQLVLLLLRWIGLVRALSSRLVFRMREWASAYWHQTQPTLGRCRGCCSRQLCEELSSLVCLEFQGLLGGVDTGSRPSVGSF